MKRKEMLMKNEILKQLANRKSVRVFEDREIPKEDKAAIITAAAMAPTACRSPAVTGFPS